jgi:type IV secretion system protein VirB6
MGAIFFLGLLFQATAGFFNSWLRQLANYFLIPVLVVMINLLVMKLFSRAASGAAAMTATTEVSQVFPFFAMGLVCLLALASVLSVASGLAGGLLTKSGFKLGKKVGKQTGRAGKKIGRGAWNLYQNSKRNTIRPTKTQRLPYGQSRPAKAKVIALPYYP